MYLTGNTYSMGTVDGSFIMALSVLIDCQDPTPTRDCSLSEYVRTGVRISRAVLPFLKKYEHWRYNRYCTHVYQKTNSNFFWNCFASSMVVLPLTHIPKCWDLNMISTFRIHHASRGRTVLPRRSGTRHWRRPFASKIATTIPALEKTNFRAPRLFFKLSCVCKGV